MPIQSVVVYSIIYSDRTDSIYLWCFLLDVCLFLFYSVNTSSSHLFLQIDCFVAKLLIFMVTLWNRADHYIFMLWFLSIFYCFLA